jgi:hypothetical protein
LDVSGCDLKGITLPTTIGGSLDVRGCDLKGITLPTTIGDGIYSDKGYTEVNAKVPSAYFFGKYATIDGMFCEIVSKRSKTINKEKHTIYTAKKVAFDKVFYIANIGDDYAHGETLELAFKDLQFKIMSAKLAKEPILPDTMFTVMHYRMITGACDFGCRSFMDSNGIAYNIVNDEAVEVAPIAAKDLLPILERNNAYGIEAIKKLIDWA